MTKIYTDIELTSDTKYAIVRIHKNLDALKKWCRKNCQFSFGYSSIQYMSLATLPCTYFCFESQQDLLMFTLMCDNTEQLSKVVIWERTLKFTIFEKD